jgi:uncharacterized membrane protein (UPF0127 family)
MPTKLKVFSVRNERTGGMLATNAKLASSFAARFMGLMFRARLEEGGGILLTSSSSIHSFFMRFRFDALYLDREGRVVKVVAAMRPWRMSLGGKGAKHTLELPAGSAERTATRAGDMLVFEAPAASG